MNIYTILETHTHQAYLEESNKRSDRFQTKKKILDTLDL